MDEDIKRALLGDHEAAKRLTDAGVLIPCPLCGKSKAHAGTLTEHGENDGLHYDVVCAYTKGGCGCATGRGYKNDHEARLAWNTRAPILSAEEMEMLDEH